MQPHSPQLPTDAPASPAPKNLKKGALLLVIVVAIVAALAAMLLPKKQVDAGRQPTTMPSGDSRTQQAQAGAYKAPTQ